MPVGNAKGAQYRLAVTVAALMLVVAPLFYFFIAMFISSQPIETRSGVDFLLYVLLIVGIVQPVAGFFIERYQVSNYRKSSELSAKFGQLYVTLTIIKLSFVEAIYIYGLVIFLITRQFTEMLYFYPIGIIWTLVFWPRRDRFERFVAQGNQA